MKGATRFLSGITLFLTMSCLGVPMPAAAQSSMYGYAAPPFTSTQSNTTPLAFGMDAEETAHVLGQPLHYVRGRPGDELYFALRRIGGGGLVPRNHRLFLQFRHGRLAGWKADWGENWMWQ